MSQDDILSISRNDLRLGKYTRRYADMSPEQLYALLWLLGEWAARDGPHPRRLAAERAIKRFHTHPLTLDECMAVMRRARVTDVDRADVALHQDARPAHVDACGRPTYVGEDGLRRLARQHLTHLRRRLVWYETQQGTEDYMRSLRNKIDTFVREHGEASRASPCSSCTASATHVVLHLDEPR